MRMKTFLSVRARDREPSPEESLRTIVRIFGGRITPFMFSMRPRDLAGDEGKPPSIRGDHDQAVIAFFQEDPVHEVAGLVVGNGEQRAGHHLDEILLRKVEVHAVRRAERARDTCRMGCSAAGSQLSSRGAGSSPSSGRTARAQHRLPEENAGCSGACRRMRSSVPSCVISTGRLSRIPLSGRWPGVSAHPCPRSTERWKGLTESSSGRYDLLRPWRFLEDSSREQVNFILLLLLYLF